MEKAVFYSDVVATIVVITTIAPGSLSAQEASLLQKINQYSTNQSIGQVTAASQLRDVQPTDWAFQALQSLVERYGCIAGYPDGTYRGDRAMTRYEFAAGLNACLDRVNELIASATADLVTAEDLGTLQRLQEEFQAELATLRGRVDSLEARTSQLEANQFSTTTKLQGEVIFDLGSVFAGEIDRRPGDPAGTTRNDESLDAVTLGSRARLRLRTSFTGNDELRIRLQARNISNYNRRFENATQVPEADLEWDGGSNNDFTLNELQYRFSLGKARVALGTHGLDPTDIVTNATFLSATMLDFFGDHNLSYDGVNANSGAGIGFDYSLNDTFSFASGYFTGTSTAATVGDDNGVFNGTNQIFSQLTFTPDSNLVLAGTYVRSYQAGPGSSSVTGNAFGLNGAYKFHSRLNVSGWVGWGDYNGAPDLVDWSLSIGLPDLFREGNYAALSVGEFANNDQWADNLATQALYRFQVSDNVSIQPGIAWIPTPLGEDDNDAVWIGNIKTTLKF